MVVEWPVEQTINIVFSTILHCLRASLSFNELAYLMLEWVVFYALLGHIFSLRLPKSAHGISDDRPRETHHAAAGHATPVAHGRQEHFPLFSCKSQ